MVIDLHCDLLSCIEQEPKLHFDHPDLNCSIPQLLKGGVRLQTLALYANTYPGSTRSVERQIALYQKLLSTYLSVAPFSTYHSNSDKLHCILAIENASGLIEEGEILDQAFKRFEAIQSVEKILYVSLTWNHENRFGGGNVTTIGLKRDGEVFLEYLSGKNVAIDLSHTSDALADGIINYIDKKKLKLTPIASHSNFRSIKDVSRNLPNHLAKEIINRGGLIGINFVRRFVGDRPQNFLEHIHHGIALNGENALCLGADFYGGIDFAHLIPDLSFPIFLPGFDSSSCYLKFLFLLGQSFSEELVQKIVSGNVENFLKKQTFN